MISQSSEEFALSNQIPEIKKVSKPKDKGGLENFSNSFQNLMLKILQSGKITDVGTETVLKQIVEALGPLGQPEEPICPCPHQTCHHFNKKHHQVCPDCHSECKTICLIDGLTGTKCLEENNSEY